MQKNDSINLNQDFINFIIRGGYWDSSNIKDSIEILIKKYKIHINDAYIPSKEMAEYINYFLEHKQYVSVLNRN